MIDAARLRDDLEELVVQLEGDLREHLAHDAATDARLRGEHAVACTARRTAQTYEAWLDTELTQAAVAYVLGCVFVRFLEDNQLITSPWLAGPVGSRLDAARDRRTAWFQQHPRETDLGYLRAAFADVAELPTMGPLFDESHNASWSLKLSPDAATLLYQFWQRRDEAGAIRHDFADSERSTRFLGNLYQDLSAATRDRYALFQTPEFVEEFILDRTLEPAITEFGLNRVTLIDPTCGSGHFLLGAFGRLLRKWQLAEPGTKAEVVVQRALDGVAGADLNPYAIAIARFRLLTAALHASDIRRLADARDYKIHLAVADSLLHGKTWGARRQSQMQLGGDHLDHVYRTEDKAAIEDVLGRRYHVVVGNPPYVTVRDPILNAEYRRYKTSQGQYSLAVPFMERFFDLAVSNSEGSGYVGMITANSFIKREFGAALVEDYLPKKDLTHVIDTAAAQIPNHPSAVILLARNRAPVGDVVRMIMFVRGDTSTEPNGNGGPGWQEIVRLVGHSSLTGQFVSVSDVPRERLASHRWPTGGGGAADVKNDLDCVGVTTLELFSFDMGRTTHTGEDEAYCLPSAAARTYGLSGSTVAFVRGEDVRDHQIDICSVALFPYSIETGEPQALDPRVERHFWPLRTSLRARRDYGQTPEQRKLRWFDHSMFFVERYKKDTAIAFADIASHNHFVLAHGRKVFNRTAPVVLLPAEAGERDHIGLAGILNSSTCCFWMKQVCFPKGGDQVGTEGARVRRTLWDERYVYNTSSIAAFPLVDPNAWPTHLAESLTEIGRRRSALRQNLDPTNRVALDAATHEARRLRERAILLQEELDWSCYRSYELVAEDLTAADGQAPEGLRLGERAFEIAMAREMARGQLQTTWFERHGSMPITEIPLDWPPAYRDLINRRLDAIANNPRLRLIEKPEYKRRWADEPWEDQQVGVIRDWLLTRMEDRRFWFASDGRPQIMSCARLADRLREDRDFLRVGAHYRKREDFDLTGLVVELAESDAVPFLAAYRYSPSGRRKREEWERTWALQREEDATGKRLEIPVPRKYSAGDFAAQTYWRLRGKLDVPKERFILYPGAERDVDSTPVIGWAGWDHLEQARALAEFTVAMRETEAWSKERIAPLLAGLDELLAWVKHWHNDRDPITRERLGDYFAGFVSEEARSMGMTVEQLRALEPVAPARRRKPRKPSAARQSDEGTP